MIITAAATVPIIVLVVLTAIALWIRRYLRRYDRDQEERDLPEQADDTNGTH
jgi:hypothetical protein